MYTLREFRASTKKAFDDAFEGHEVVIDRAGQRFQLVSLVDLPLGGSKFESTPRNVKPIKLAPKIEAVDRAWDMYDHDKTTLLLI